MILLMEEILQAPVYGKIPIIYRGWYIIPVGAGFLNHQQYFIYFTDLLKS